MFIDTKEGRRPRVTSAWGRGALALATVGVLSLSACSASGDDTGADGPINIGMIIPLTGPVPQPTYVKAAELRINEINADGGIDGRNVELSVYDMGADPNSAVNATNKAIADGVDIAIGVPWTSAAKAVRPVLERAGLPLLYMANTAELSKDVFDSDNYFALQAPSSALGAADAEFVKEVLKAENPALTSTTDEGSQVVIGKVREAITEAGLQIQSDQKVAPTVTDMTPQVLNLKGADVIVTNNTPAVDTILIRNARQNGVDVPIILSTAGPEQVANNLTPADQLRDVYYPGVCAADIPLEHNTVEESKPYLTAWAAEYGDLKQGTFAAMSYDAVGIAAEAFAKVGTGNSEALINYLTNAVDFVGACGAYKSDPTTNILALPENVFIVSIENGQLKAVD
ncbi:ABC transporter substrate-binding protein [Rhodococcus sp. IEGM 1366]|uniref:ABC transporter substrate-binding protein n=1 Tax=Rhodococcus sp. IEGM 1366 TaxID=3082223 RepID=UPI002952A81D|nr:ABC transporter substrate-binding protein [Rhodococcus sp. IEGM 1366]MDV8071002.1 ABC transporter substrate-binding protein [Rhodococcus sp. IEGM 1366]